MRLRNRNKRSLNFDLRSPDGQIKRQSLLNREATNGARLLIIRATGRLLRVGMGSHPHLCQFEGCRVVIGSGMVVGAGMATLRRTRSSLFRVTVPFTNSRI